AALDGLGVDATADITYGGNGTAGMTYTIELTKHDAVTKSVLAGDVYELEVMRILIRITQINGIIRLHWTD
ncbi:hypothetical protein WP50_33700, partial [Lactiplantibacillus plantarum]